MVSEPEPGVPVSTGPWVQRTVRLLDADPDLAAEMTGGELERARHVVLPTIALEAGSWDDAELARVRGVQGEVRGFLVLRGAVTIDLAIAGQVCTRLLTPGELILLDGSGEDSIPVRAGWTVLESASLAILDEQLLAIGSRLPGLLSTLLKRAAEQVRHALMQQAIGQLPRVEDRLLALMWSIADRRGVVRRDGIWVHLPVTHATLAQMIGARRPTVSLGLRTLSERGFLTAENGGWLLSRASLAEFASPTRRPDVTTDEP